MTKRARTRPPKVPNVLAEVKKHLDLGRYLDTTHLTQRSAERRIIISEILYVLRNGHHETRKDQWKERYGTWNYAIRGRTLDDRDLRIVVAFDTEGMPIITAIEL